MAVLGFPANVVLIPLVMFYLLQEWPRILDELQSASCRALVDGTTRVLGDIDSVMSEFLRGQLGDAAAGGVHSAGLWLAGLNFWLPVGVLTGLPSSSPTSASAAG